MEPLSKIPPALQQREFPPSSEPQFIPPPWPATAQLKVVALEGYPLYLDPLFPRLAEQVVLCFVSSPVGAPLYRAVFVGVLALSDASEMLHCSPFVHFLTYAQPLARVGETLRLPPSTGFGQFRVTRVEVKVVEDFLFALSPLRPSSRQVLSGANSSFSAARYVVRVAVVEAARLKRDGRDSLTVVQCYQRRS